MTSLIILCLLLAACAAGGILYYCYNTWKQDTQSDRAAKTAQDFINVRDIEENNLLYTVDNMVFAYLKIDGMSLEMFEPNELKNISSILAKNLVSVHFPWKFLSVSRPMDIKETLQIYSELQEISSPGHKALLQQEIDGLISMTKRGETIERQHYAVMWEKEGNETQLLKNSAVLCRILSSSKISCKELDRQEITELCDLVSNPANSRFKQQYDFNDELLRAIIR